MVGLSLWHLILNSDRMSCGILLVLFVLSVVSWSVIVYMVSSIQKHILACGGLVSWLQKETVLVSQLQGYVASGEKSNVGISFLNQQFLFLNKLGLHNTNTLSNDTIEHIDTYAYHTIDQYIAQSSKYIPLFVTIAGIAPLLGLLGTVWGLIHSFLSISQTSVADLATVAPGISEALITTLAGLLVAIPALVFSNILQAQIAQLQTTLENLAMEYRLVLVSSGVVKESCASR